MTEPPDKWCFCENDVLTRLTILENKMEEQAKTIELVTASLAKLQLNKPPITHDNNKPKTTTNQEGIDFKCSTAEKTTKQPTKTIATTNADSTTIKPNNNEGFCVGDQVMITYDRSGNYFSPKDRKTPTHLEGKIGFIDKVTPCYVNVKIEGERSSIKKANHNVRLITPVPGTETVVLPSGKIRKRSPNGSYTSTIGETKNISKR